MTAHAPLQELVALVADLDMEYSLRGLLNRRSKLGIAFSGQLQIRRHPNRDPGCRVDSQEFLRPFCNQFRYALVMFDLEGSGKDTLPRTELENRIESQLFANGWQNRAAVVVIAPELENWVWSNSPEVDRICGWNRRSPSLREWLVAKGHVKNLTDKPERPKEAFRAALRAARKQPSASLFRQLAESVDFEGCVDPAFNKLRAVLQKWFPKNS